MKIVERPFGSPSAFSSPGGLLFAAFITRFAFLRDAALNEPQRLFTQRGYYERLMETGTHNEPAHAVTRRGHGFTFSHFDHPAEVIPFMEGHGLKTRALLGCEGVVAGLESQVNQLQGEAWNVWVDVNYRLSKEPSLWGASDHLLYVGEK